MWAFSAGYCDVQDVELNGEIDYVRNVTAMVVSLVTIYVRVGTAGVQGLECELQRSILLPREAAPITNKPFVGWRSLWPNQTHSKCDGQPVKCFRFRPRFTVFDSNNREF